MRRIPPSERTRAAIEELLSGGLGAEEDPKRQLIVLGVRRVVEEALEAAVRDLLGRGYYERQEGGAGGYRNGYRPGRLKTSEGEVEYQVPQVRQVDASDLASLRSALSGRSEALETLALEMFARGCSVRDIEETFRTAEGKSLVSRTAASEISEALWAEYEAFATRDLSELRPLYLFVDGLSHRLRPGSRREAVLVAWAITWEGKKVLIHAAPGSKESTECVKAFYEDLKRRGLAEPVLVVTDGAAGVIRATEECFPKALRQRCLAHKMRNLLGKLPEEAVEEIKHHARAAYQAPSPELARDLGEALVARYEKKYPTAMRCFEEDFEACIAHLYCPPAHRQVIRTTNMLERLFREERRRSRAAGCLFGERPVLKMMYAALIRGSERWNGLRIEPLAKKQLQRLQDQLHHQYRQTHAPVVASKLSTPDDFYSKIGT